MSNMNIDIMHCFAEFDEQTNLSTLALCACELSYPCEEACPDFAHTVKEKPPVPSVVHNPPGSVNSSVALNLMKLYSWHAKICNKNNECKCTLFC